MGSELLKLRPNSNADVHNRMHGKISDPDPMILLPDVMNIAFLKRGPEQLPIHPLPFHIIGAQLPIELMLTQQLIRFAPGMRAV